LDKTPSSPESQAPRSAWIGLGIGICLAIPTLFTWAYFQWAAGLSEGAQRAIYLTVKVAQFAFPVIWVLLILRERPLWRRASMLGVGWGAAFSAAVIAAGLSVYWGVLRDSPWLERAAEAVREKVASFGIHSIWQYALLAGFYSLAHSLLEEYYWRWFIFGQLQRITRLWSSIVISACGFAAHHVIVLAAFFQGSPALAALLAAAVAIGGAFWAWLYGRTGSLAGPWLSHLMIDAGVFWIGYDMIRDRLV
jgi:membrane protease YdiL (CAAX protease family)